MITFMASQNMLTFLDDNGALFLVDGLTSRLIACVDHGSHDLGDALLAASVRLIQSNHNSVHDEGK